MNPKNKIRVALSALAISLTAVAGVAGAAEAAPKAPKAKITIKAEGGGFHGYVKSSKSFCLDERKVTVHNASTGQAILTDTTGPDGSWDTGNPGIRTGAYYARVSRSPGCKGATSKTVQAQS